MKLHQKDQATDNVKRIEVTHKDLPLYCPTPGMSQWNSHPKVFISLVKTGTAICPYCGTEYVQTDWSEHGHSGH